MKLRAALVVSLLLMAGTAHAEVKCTPTARVNAPNYPGKDAIPTTNNLLRPTGKAVEAEAQRLIVTGRVLDSQCMPVKEATVELWQMNPFGRWYLAEEEEIATANPVFAGAGRTVTDAEGNFHFITGFPGVGTNTTKTGKGKKATSTTVQRAPQIYIRVKSRGFETFSTALFFEQDRRNATDPVYQKLSGPARNSVTMTMTPNGEDEVVGSKDIILAGKAPYRTY